MFLFMQRRNRGSFICSEFLGFQLQGLCLNPIIAPKQGRRCLWPHCCIHGWLLGATKHVYIFHSCACCLDMGVASCGTGVYCGVCFIRRLLIIC